MIRSIASTNGKPICGILEVTEIKSIPYVALSRPFVERLIGIIRREYLDHMLFWTTADLENKLLDFRTYFNNHRTHTSRRLSCGPGTSARKGHRGPVPAGSDERESCKPRLCRFGSGTLRRSVVRGITLLHFDDRMNESYARSFRTGLPSAIR